MSERYAARGNVVWNGESIVATAYGPDADGHASASDVVAKDIAARLNGPSPAEVAALLRSVEWVRGHDGEEACPCCHATKAEGHDDCALDAMIKQCEGA